MPRPADRDTPLLDKMRRFPGGVEALAVATGISKPTLYRVAKGGAVRPPYRVLERLAPALRLQLEALVRLWQRSRVSPD